MLPGKYLIAVWAAGRPAEPRSGGVTIASTPEGGRTPTASFVDQSASPQRDTLSGGTLTDQTTGTTAGSGLSAVVLTAQGGSITVSATDTTAYWLGGGAAGRTSRKRRFAYAGHCD